MVTSTDGGQRRSQRINGGQRRILPKQQMVGTAEVHSEASIQKRNWMLHRTSMRERGDTSLAVSMTACSVKKKRGRSYKQLTMSTKSSCRDAMCAQRCGNRRMKP